MNRRRWRRWQCKPAPDQFVFLDETWAKTNMTRLRGRSLNGTRLVEHVPHGHWKTTTFLAGIRTHGWVAPLVVDGAINGKLFLGWVEQHLIKVLRPGDVVIMDNLSSHKAKGAAEAIESAILDDDGIRIAAAPSLERFAVNNRIGGPETGEGNILFDAGHYSSEGFPTGANISLSEAENTLVQGNTLVLLADGLSAFSLAETLTPQKSVNHAGRWTPG